MEGGGREIEKQGCSEGIEGKGEEGAKRCRWECRVHGVSRDELQGGRKGERKRISFVDGEWGRVWQGRYKECFVCGGKEMGLLVEVVVPAALYGVKALL